MLCLRSTLMKELVLCSLRVDPIASIVVFCFQQKTHWNTCEKWLNSFSHENIIRLTYLMVSYSVHFSLTRDKDMWCTCIVWQELFCMNKGEIFGLINTLKCVIPDQSLSEAIWLRGSREPGTLFYLKGYLKIPRQLIFPSGITVLHKYVKIH